MSKGTLEQKIEKRKQAAKEKNLLTKVSDIWVLISGHFYGAPQVNGLDFGDLEITGDQDMNFDPTSLDLYVKIKQGKKLIFEASGTEYTDGSLSQYIHAYVPGDWEEVIQTNYDKVQAAYKQRAEEADAEVEAEERRETEKLKERFGLDD